MRHKAQTSSASLKYFTMRELSSEKEHRFFESMVCFVSQVKVRKNKNNKIAFDGELMSTNERPCRSISSFLCTEDKTTTGMEEFTVTFHFFIPLVGMESYGNDVWCHSPSSPFHFTTRE